MYKNMFERRNITMKKMTSIIALLLAMLMLASCGGTQSAQETAVVDNSENEIRTTVSAFLDAVFDLDEAKAKTYTADESIVNEINSELHLTSALDTAMAGLDGPAGEIFPEEKMRGYLETVIRKIFKTVTYDVTDVEINGNTAVASVTMKVPDIDSNDMSSIDFEGLMKDSLGFDITDSATLIQEFLDRKGMTLTDVATKYASDQSALVSDLLDAFSPEFDRMFEVAGDEAAKIAASGKKEEFNGKITLEKGSDNTWKITKID